MLNNEPNKAGNNTSNNNISSHLIFSDVVANVKIKNEANYLINIKEKEVNGKTSYSNELYEADRNNGSLPQQHNMCKKSVISGTNKASINITDIPLYEPKNPLFKLYYGTNMLRRRTRTFAYKRFKNSPTGKMHVWFVNPYIRHENATGSELRRYLLNSNSLIYCTNIPEVTKIQFSTSECGDLDFL